jgi:fumarate reductase subunit D
MAKRSNEPFLWSLFSAGGVVAAMLIPVLLFLFGLAFPLGWLEAHRFRFTLYDGLQIKHLNEIIAVVCYGGAIAGTALAAYLLFFAL